MRRNVGGIILPFVTPWDVSPVGRVCLVDHQRCGHIVPSLVIYWTLHTNRGRGYSLATQTVSNIFLMTMGPRKRRSWWRRESICLLKRMGRSRDEHTTKVD